MSCKLGSKYVCLQKEEYLRVDMDDKACIVTPVPEWNQPASSSKASTATYANARDYSVLSKRGSIPGSALELVTTGSLTTGFAGHTYCSTIGCAFKVSAKLVSLSPSGHFPELSRPDWNLSLREVVTRKYYFFKNANESPLPLMTKGCLLKFSCRLWERERSHVPNCGILLDKKGNIYSFQLDEGRR